MSSGHDPARFRRLVVLGAVVIVVGLVAAISVGLVAQRRADGAVAGLARAPVGCDTTLEFTATGDFVVFVETTGRLDRLEGGCDAPTTYDRRRARPPEVTVEFTDVTGAAVALRSTAADAYDTDGFVGRPIGQIRIESTGRHLVRVTADDDDVAVAVGRDPAGAGRPLTVVAGVVAALALLAGAVCIAIGLRRRPGAPPPPDPSPQVFVPAGSPPVAPPAPPPPPGAVVTPPGEVPPAEPPRSPWAPPAADGP